MAIRTWRGLTNANWNNPGSWLEGATPTSADDCIFDATSSGCTVNITNAACRSINFTAYTRTITMNNPIAIGVNGGSNAGVTLGPSMGIAGTGALNILTANSTLTSNGRIWPNTLNIGTVAANSNTWCTIADVWTQYGDIALTSAALGYNISGSGRIDFYGSRIFCTGRLNSFGAVKLVILSACTFSGTQNPITSHYIELPFDFSAGTNTVTIGNINITNTNWKYYSGNVSAATNTTINVFGGTTTFDMNPAVFHNLRLGFQPTETVTFKSESPTNVANDLLTNVTIRNLFVSGSSINISGSCLFDSLLNRFGGDTVIRMRGNGIFSLTGAGGNLGTSLSIESGVNTTTIRGDLAVFQTTGFINPTITYTSGAVDLTSHSNLNIQSVNMNTSGMIWKNITIIAGAQIPLLSTLSATTITIQNGTNITFQGSYGFDTQNFTWIVNASIQTLFLAPNIEYIIKNSIFIRSISTIQLTLSSSDGVNRALLTVNDSATQDLNYINATRIDSSNGQTIWVRFGTLSNTINWRLLTNPVTKSTSFIL